MKFAGFQEKYFEDRFEPEFQVVPKEELRNRPVLVKPPKGVPCPEPGRPMDPEDFQSFVKATAEAVASLLGLEPA